MSTPGSAPESKKVVLVGSAGSGKSALVQRAVANTFTTEYHQTFGADLCVKSFSDKKASISIWSTGGHERYRALLEQFFMGADAILLCFDMLSQSSFLEVQYWFNEYKRNAPEALALLVGTKSDDADGIKIKPQDALKQAKAWGIEFRAVSSKTGMNVAELFEQVVLALK
ncbi:P-loop containing nucleoside triphosphate hydrolase protein [Phlyctochytrium arcticum]|nr:P-loop containing nucleoside triphosphate hydrolase protein [Phlyctochytrium arcticum]